MAVCVNSSFSQLVDGKSGLGDLYSPKTARTSNNTWIIVRSQEKLRAENQ